MKQFYFLVLLSSSAGCAPVNTQEPTPIPQSPIGAFESGEYRNLFEEYLGKSDDDVQAKLDGVLRSRDHSTGLVAMAAAAALAADPEIGKPFVQELWDAQILSGKWRYYAGMLYMLAMLHTSGNSKIYIAN